MKNNRYRHPTQCKLGTICNILFNSKLILFIRRTAFYCLPFPTLRSEVKDVVYMSWLVDSKSLADYIPEGVGICEKRGRTLITVLTYRHHHFAPVYVGPLRRIFPSPLQSSWRVYVNKLPKNDCLDKGVILYLKNTFDSLLFAMGTRLTSDIEPSHFSPKFIFNKECDHYNIHIEGGIGSAPSLDATLSVIEDKGWLPKEFEDYFGSKEAALKFICLQGSAICYADSIQKIVRAGIRLPVDLSTITPLKFEAGIAPFLDELNGNPSEPFCFVVPYIPFDVLWEKILK